MDSSHDDLLLMELLEPLERVAPVKRREDGARRKRRLWVLAAAGAAVLALAGAAISSGFVPFTGITAVDREPTADDVASPAVIDQLRLDESSGEADQIGMHRLDSTRMVGYLPSGRKVLVVATTKDRLCVVVAGAAESCGNQLTRESPITFTTFARGGTSGEPPVAYGVALDGVVSVSFSVSGRKVTVPVQHNFFAYEGLASDGAGSFSAPTVTFTDGTSEVAQ